MLEKIYEVLSLTEWKKKRVILQRLKLNRLILGEREFRKQVEKNNKMYGDGVVDYYICHSQNGYKLTYNWEDLEISIRDKRKRALTMLAECSKAEKQFQRRNNVKMEDIL